MKKNKTKAFSSRAELGREFYLVRLYWGYGGFWMSICEFLNHDNGHNWSLFQCGWIKGVGVKVSISSS